MTQNINEAGTERALFRRRHTSESRAGNAGIGGDNPIRVQSMTNTSTLDTEGSVAQILRIAGVGGEIVRLTTQGVREAENMARIRESVREAGCDVPLVADVHFNPQAAYTAARTCDKVRINPGNFVDAARTFKKLEFTPEEYAAEIERIREALLPFLNICRENSTCVRLGVNHGSLSDRIMSRYGDTPAGMVESVMEYLRIAREADFDNIVISIKASNVVVMVETVHKLVDAMDKEDMHFPLHLGVTEAGDGEDGRVKSAVGIGSLLLEGIGDTIRVSLSEDPENEIPVGCRLRDFATTRIVGVTPLEECPFPRPFPGEASREKAAPVADITANGPVVIGHDIAPDAIPAAWHICNADEEIEMWEDSLPVVLSAEGADRVARVMRRIDSFVEKDGKNPVILRLGYDCRDWEQLQIEAATEFGSLLLRGYCSGIWIDAPHFPQEKVAGLALGILQAARLRISKTEYIACPGCGRTLFDLQSTLREVKEATKEMVGLKIGVMGCIVNGPGEMADADYGYVGAGPGRVSLYKGKQLVQKNIPASEALPALLALIRADQSC